MIPRWLKDTSLKGWTFKIAAILAMLAVGGFLVAASGIIPIKASSRHWAITRWFLNFSKERSVVTHTLGLKAPPLDEPLLVLKGAGHYETGCFPCHGSPELRQPRIARAMTPTPPYLSPQISKWKPEELFYIVKHGIKFTGMPAWPARERDDEVWAMVAFLRKLPKLNAAEYRHLVGGPSAANGQVAPLSALTGPQPTPRAVIASCARCHGADGHGRGLGAFPKLAGQKPAYLQASLDAYARGTRHSGIMEPIAAGLSAEDMTELARYFSGLAGPSPSASPQESTPALEHGKEIATVGIPSQRVPACVECHGPSALPRNANYPALAGQYAEYLVLQLELFRDQHRGGTEYSHLMQFVAGHLTAEQMRDVAAYFSSLASGAEPEARKPHQKRSPP